jgi:hypothetical protein
MKYKNEMILVAFCLFSLASGCWTWGSGGGRGKIIERWEESNNPLKVRVTDYEEKDPVASELS